MKLKYLINDEDDHYVEIDLNLTTKNLSIAYINQEQILTSHAINVTEVFSANTLKNPFIQVAKKERVWDFHIFNFDEFGKEVRRTIGILLEDDLYPTKVEFINDGDKDYTLIDYITHPLDVYNSTLQFAHFTFDNIEKMTGRSSIDILSPQITSNNQLKLGYDADILFDLSGSGEINLNTIPVAIFFKIDHFSPNEITEEPQAIFNIGINTFTLSTKEGIRFYTSGNTSTELYSSEEVKDGMTFKLEIRPNRVVLFANHQAKEIPGFHRSSISTLNLKGRGDNGEFTLIKDLIIQGLENFRTDFIAPRQITQLEAEAGFEEVFLKWKENEEEDLAGYHVYLDGKRHNIYMIPSADYQVTGLKPGVDHVISVVAIDKSGNESMPVSITIRGVSSPQFEVRHVESYTSRDGTHITWENPEYANFYAIDIRRTNIHTGEEIVLIELQKETTSYIDTDELTPGYYKYSIRTIDVYNKKTSGVEFVKWIPSYPDEVEEPEEPEVPPHPDEG